MPKEDNDEIRDYVAPPGQLPGNLGGGFDMATNPLARMGMKFFGYIAERRENPKNDVLTLMAQQTYEDGSLPEIIDIVGLATFLFGGGARHHRPALFRHAAPAV